MTISSQQWWLRNHQKKNYKKVPQVLGYHHILVRGGIFCWKNKVIIHACLVKIDRSCIWPDHEVSWSFNPFILPDVSGDFLTFQLLFSKTKILMHCESSEKIKAPLPRTFAEKACCKAPSNANFHSHRGFPHLQKIHSRKLTAKGAEKWCLPIFSGKKFVLGEGITTKKLLPTFFRTQEIGKSSFSFIRVIHLQIVGSYLSPAMAADPPTNRRPLEASGVPSSRDYLPKEYQYLARPGHFQLSGKSVAFFTFIDII